MIDKELIYLWATYLNNAKEINQDNVKHFQRCVMILYKVNVCGTCSTTINTYYSKMKIWFNGQIAKDPNFLSYGEAPVEVKPKEVIKPTLENRSPKPKEEVKIEDIPNLEEGKIKVTKTKKKK